MTRTAFPCKAGVLTIALATILSTAASAAFAPATGERAAPASALPNKVAQVDVSGNEHISREAILTVVGTKAGEQLDLARLDQDDAKIRALGWFKAVLHRVEDTPAGKKVTFVATEWPVIQKIEFSGNTVFDRAALMGVLATRENQILNLPRLEADAQRIHDLYAQKGYMATVGPDLAQNLDQTGVLKIPILEMRVAEVRIQGNHILPDAVVRRELTLTPGKLYSVENLKEDYGRLQRLPLVESAEPKPNSPDPNKVVILWEVKERPITCLPEFTFEMGFKFSESQGLVFQWERHDVRAEIAAVRKSLKGNASDAERYYRLGLLYGRAAAERESAAPVAAETEPIPGMRLHASEAKSSPTDRDQEKKAFARSLALYRQQVKSHPHDGRLLAQYAEALSAADRAPEAERVARQAVKDAPREWLAWAILADIVDSHASQALSQAVFGSISKKSMLGWKDLEQLNRLLQKTPSPEQLERWRKLAAEARGYMDHAVAVAPHKPQAYRKRIGFRWMHGVQQVFARERPGDPMEAAVTTMLSPESVADLKQVARLSPRDYRAIWMAIFVEMIAAGTQNGHDLNSTDEELWDSLPEKTKASAREAKTRLEKLALDKDVRTAAGASTMLGMLQIVMEDAPGAKASLRRAITLDPSSEQAWTTLAGLTGKEDGREKSVSVCTELLKRKASARGRLTLARVYEELDKLHEAEEQIQAALRLEPNNFTGNLALAILLMKRNNDLGALAQAGKLLEKAGKLLEQAATPDERTRYQVARALYYSRAGDAAKARQVLEQVPKTEEKR